MKHQTDSLFPYKNEVLYCWIQNFWTGINPNFGWKCGCWIGYNFSREKNHPSPQHFSLLSSLSFPDANHFQQGTTEIPKERKRGFFSNPVDDDLRKYQAG